LKAKLTIKTSSDLDFGGPAVYRIVVQGTLGKEWSDRLAGMEITAINRGTDAPHTELRRFVQDQAELSGVLESLYELHLPIVKVEQDGDSR
jgi:hypothetical protein